MGIDNDAASPTASPTDLATSTKNATCRPRLNKQFKDTCYQQRQNIKKGREEVVQKFE